MIATSHPELRSAPCGETRVASRLWVFSALTVVLLLIQYPLGRMRYSLVLDAVFLLALIHCVVLLVDSACVHCLRRKARRSQPLVWYFIPAERRGISQLLTLVAVLASVFLALEIHELGEVADVETR